MPDYPWEDGSNSLHSPVDLKNDAVNKGFKPGAIAITVAGRELYLTSWPYHDDPDSENYRSARIMARTVRDDPETNTEFSYYNLMLWTGSFDLNVENLVETVKKREKTFKLIKDLQTRMHHIEHIDADAHDMLFNAVRNLRLCAARLEKHLKG